MAARDGYTFPGPDVFVHAAARDHGRPGITGQVLKLAPVRDALRQVGLAIRQDDESVRNAMIRSVIDHIDTLKTGIAAIFNGLDEIDSVHGGGSVQEIVRAAGPPQAAIAAPHDIRPQWGMTARPTVGTINSAPVGGMGTSSEIPPGYDPAAVQPGLAIKEVLHMSKQAHHNQGRKGNVHPHPDGSGRPVDPMNPDAPARPAPGDAVDPARPGGDAGPPPDQTPHLGVPVGDPAGEARRAAGETSNQAAAGGPSQSDDPDETPADSLPTDPAGVDPAEPPPGLAPADEPDTASPPAHGARPDRRTGRR